MDGIIIVDKPPDWTSHDVVAKLRNTLRTAEHDAGKTIRVGHGGTLDPMATGVLPVFIGRATRAAEFCENAEKEYIAGLRPGITTDTQDTTGNIIRTGSAAVSSDELAAVIPRFLGALKQTPPMYSAIKIDGKRLYDLARRGSDVPRPARDIFISDIELLEGGQNDFTLRIVCSKGTYIRTICNDIGDALGCGGAMCSLRRIRAGSFTIGMARPLGELLEAISGNRLAQFLIPVDAVFPEYQAVSLSDTETRKCRNGARCPAGGLKDGKYRFYSPDNEFLGLGEARSGELRMIKNF